jgi:hypothetical protein
MNRRIARAAQVGALVLALVVVPAALAATKGHGGGGGSGTSGSSSISAPVMVTDTGTPGISWGDTVTFNVSTTATTTPFVNLQCYQNGVQVLSGMKGFWDGSIDVNWNFGLSSPMWQSGAADCAASLEMQTKRGWAQLASTSFHVNA